MGILISDMTQIELEYFELLCSKFEIQASSTEGLREVIKSVRNQFLEQKKMLEMELQEKNKYLAEVEKMLGKLEKGELRK